ncbi:MAG: alanine-tRNA synthetase second additional domain-containing protein [Clostridiales bacterium]|nr:alanine-tRNA synthetase second additional domain-containing protein [Clostridiales bacterium]
MAIQQVELHPLYSVYFAPRGYKRMVQLGNMVAQRHLSAFDKLIGIIGEAGSGKSLLIRGMFPGLELTNDDNGVNVRPLPLLDLQEHGFYQPHTYHVDVRFEEAFTQRHVIAEAVREVINKGRRVVVEHFDLLYPLLDFNAQLLIGIGDEVIVSRPTMFGPEPDDIAQVVFSSIKYRRMAHSAEDLTERYLRLYRKREYAHGDIRHGFVLRFPHEVDIDLDELESFVRDLIAKDLPISFADEEHIYIGKDLHHCTGPRMHVTSTGQIENFRVLRTATYDELTDAHLLVGLVGEDTLSDTRDLNRIHPY